MAGHTWTKTTLAAQIVGELNIQRNAAGGSVPDRLGNIILECFDDLYEREDWIFRRRADTTTLVMVANDTKYTAPTDFGKLDPRWLGETSKESWLQFTDDEQFFARFQYDDIDRTGRPRLALIRPLITEGEGEAADTYGYEFLITPTPDKSYNYPLVYLCTVPTLGATDIPVWPTKFHRLWHHYALARAMRHFRRDPEAWKEAWAFSQAEIKQAVKQNNETLVNRPTEARDHYQDHAMLTSSQHADGTH